MKHENNSWLPKLSTYEPEGAFEGSVDPLGLQNVAELLADLLLPGFTVRIERARCLTLATLAADLAHDPSLLLIHNDDPHQAILAFERLCVYVLAKETNVTTAPLIRGFPGRLKALRAVQGKMPLTLSNYIKGPVTNGLVGTYFRALRSGKLLDDDRKLRGDGESLLRSWEQDNPGWKDLKRKVIQFIRADLQDGDFPTQRPWFTELAEICYLNKAKARERKELQKAFFAIEAGLQSTTLSRLCMKDLKGSQNFSRKNIESNLVDEAGRGDIERRIVQQFANPISDTIEHGRELRAVAQTILLYEEVAHDLLRLFNVLRVSSLHCTVTIDEVLRKTKTKNIVQKNLLRLKQNIKRLRKQVDIMVAANVPSVNPTRNAETAMRNISRILDEFPLDMSPNSALHWAAQRHFQVQQAKAKQTWFIRDGNEKYRFFPEYVLEELPEDSQSFLFAYRLVNARSVLKDLSLVR
jgi:hypothetical protein